MQTKYHFGIITENIHPFVGGGIAEWCHGIGKNLAKMGHEVTILAKWKNKISPDVHKDKVYRVIPMFGHDWRIYRYWYSLYYLIKFLRKNPAAIIIATTWDLGAPFSFLKRFFPGSRMIVVGHGKEITGIRNGRKLRSFQRTINSATFVIAVSQFTRTEILKRVEVDSGNHILFIPNGIDLRLFSKSNNKNGFFKNLGIRGNRKVILTLARVVERKGHDTVLKSLPAVLKEFPDTVYIIAGPVPDKDYHLKLKAIINQLNLKKYVIFSDFINKEDLSAYYSICDVYVMVSRELKEKGDSEGFGITFLEANACQVPVIGSYSGGIPDAIENEITGYLISPDDEIALSEKILFLFRNPDVARRLGEAGRRRVESSFTWEKISKRIYKEFSDRIS